MVKEAFPLFSTIQMSIIMLNHIRLLQLWWWPSKANRSSRGLISSISRWNSPVVPALYLVNFTELVAWFCCMVPKISLILISLLDTVIIKFLHLMRLTNLWLHPYSREGLLLKLFNFVNLIRIQLVILPFHNGIMLKCISQYLVSGVLFFQFSQITLAVRLSWMEIMIVGTWYLWVSHMRRTGTAFMIGRHRPN